MELHINYNCVVYTYKENAMCLNIYGVIYIYKEKCYVL